MKKFLLLAIVGLLTTNFAFSQSDMTKYNAFISKADSLYDIKEYQAAVVEYKNAFDANDGKAYSVDRYNAACTFALAGDSEKAFYHMFYLAEHPKLLYKNYDHVIADTDLNSLHLSLIHISEPTRPY